MGTLELTSGHFHLLAHTADIGLEASAPSREELFITVAKGLRAMLFGISPAEPALRLEVRLEAGEGAELLVVWLNEIICLSELTRLVPAAFEIDEISDRHLRGIITGEPFDAERHTVERTAKAVTYHQLVMEEREEGWYARVYIDL